MKVILNDYIEHVGERGDSVDVKPGFARNYLLPKALAYPDTPGNRRRFEQEQHHWEEMDLGRRSAAEGLAKGLDGVELKFERRAGEKDVLFGSVSVADIAKELRDRPPPHPARSPHQRARQLRGGAQRSPRDPGHPAGLRGSSRRRTDSGRRRSRRCRSRNGGGARGRCGRGCHRTRSDPRGRGRVIHERRRPRRTECRSVA